MNDNREKLLLMAGKLQGLADFADASTVKSIAAALNASANQLVEMAEAQPEALQGPEPICNWLPRDYMTWQMVVRELAVIINEMVDRVNGLVEAKEKGE